MPTISFADRTLDARPDRVDLRDRRYQPRLSSLPLQYPAPVDIARYLTRYGEDGMILDQGREGACTGFGLAAVINYLRWKQAVDAGEKAPDKVSERMLYHLARFYDEWSGEDYEGSSCRGAMKGWQRHGVCDASHWRYRDADGKVAFIPPAAGWDKDAASRPLGAYYRIDKDSISDMQAALVEVGAIYASATVHRGWFLDPVGRMAPIGLPVIEVPEDRANVGGHAFALVGFTREGFVIQNSWGPGWGVKGFAILPYTDWVERGSDAWVAVMGSPMEGATAPRYHVPVALQEAATKGLGTVSLSTKEAATAPSRREIPAWTTEQAYAHAVVMGNNGVVLNRSLTAGGGLDALRQVMVDEPTAWLAEHGAKHVALYAHGGLNSEAGALDRARLLGPYFEANGIYPIFFIWKTGFVDSLAGIVGDEIRGVPSQGVWSDLLEGDQGAGSRGQGPLHRGGLSGDARPRSVDPDEAERPRRRARAARHPGARRGAPPRPHSRGLGASPAPDRAFGGRHPPRAPAGHRWGRWRCRRRPARSTRPPAPCASRSTTTVRPSRAACWGARR